MSIKGQVESFHVVWRRTFLPLTDFHHLLNVGEEEMHVGLTESSDQRGVPQEMCLQNLQTLVVGGLGCDQLKHGLQDKKREALKHKFHTNNSSPVVSPPPAGQEADLHTVGTKLKVKSSLKSPS